MIRTRSTAGLGANCWFRTVATSDRSERRHCHCLGPLDSTCRAAVVIRGAERTFGWSESEILTQSYLETLSPPPDLAETVRGPRVDRTEGVVSRANWSMPSVRDTSWWSSRAHSGGQLVEQSTHVFDVHRYLLGEVETVRGDGTDGLLADGLDFQMEALSR